MEENKIDSLVPLFDEQTKSYYIDKYDELFGVVNQYCEKYLKMTEVIQDEGDFKLLKNIRTEVRKQKDTIANARKQVNEMLLGNLNYQLTSLEKLLTKCDDVLKERVDSYKEKQGEVKAQTYTITISCSDPKVIDKIKAFAEKQTGVSIKVK